MRSRVGNYVGCSTLVGMVCSAGLHIHLAAATARAMAAAYLNEQVLVFTHSPAACSTARAMAVALCSGRALGGLASMSAPLVESCICLVAEQPEQPAAMPAKAEWPGKGTVTACSSPCPPLVNDEFLSCSSGSVFLKGWVCSAMHLSGVQCTSVVCQDHLYGTSDLGIPVLVQVTRHVM
jgi:hypothetical protein